MTFDLMTLTFDLFVQNTEHTE